MVSIDDISYAFKNYFSNFINSISLDEKLLAPAPKEEWIRRLQDCARFQASVRQEDQHVIHSLNTLLTEQSDTLTAAHYDTILKYCRKLYYANSNEPPILLDLAQKLIPHYERLDDTENLLFLYCCAGYASSQLSRIDSGNVRKLSSYYYKKVISYRDEIDTFQNPVSRDYIFIAYNNLIRIGPRAGWLTLEESYSLCQELYSIRCQKKFRQFDKSNPRIPSLCKKAIDGFLNNDCLADLEGFSFTENMHQFCITLSKKRFEEDRTKAKSFYHCPASTVFQYYKILAEEGSISWEEACEILDDYYFKKEKLLSEEIDFDHLTFYVDFAMLLISFLNKTALPASKKKAKIVQYRLLLKNFLSNCQTVLERYTLCEGLYFATFHPLILETFENPVEKTNFIIDSVVSSHLPTMTHSVMVSYLAEAILKHVFLYCPEILITPKSHMTLDELLTKQPQVTDYAVQAALLHDIGKNGIVPVIMTQHRNLTDYEYSLLKMHPQKGADYLSDRDFIVYRDIALGHHKSYDGKRGYPVDFDNVHSPYRPIIDLIHICDCIDAATDYLSRNYNRVKSFATVMEELEAEKGTEYNPVLVDLILEHDDLYRELRFLVEQKREDIYYDVYLTFANKHVANMEHL